MTVRELRAMLFNVENQDLTVRELRNILFQQMDQDRELTDVDMVRMTVKEETKNES